MAAVAPARGQDANVTQQGTAFANSIAPTSASQVVNPNGVNATAWSGSTATPTAVPPNLGAFSAPTTSSSTYTSAQSVGLGGLGNQALSDCANFIPGPNADPLKVQQCAATNFLSNQCMTPDNVQAGVISHLSMSWNTGTNCAGTYGQAVQTFNMQNQVTPTDPVFAAMGGLKSTAPAQVTPNCTTQTVVTTPAQYAMNTCVVQSGANAHTCSQYLNVSVTTTTSPATQTDSCNGGTLEGNYCVSTTTVPATITYVCPAGYVYDGKQCTETLSAPATPTSSCPAGSVLQGNSCVTTKVDGNGVPDCSFAKASSKDGWYGYCSAPGCVQFLFVPVGDCFFDSPTFSTWPPPPAPTGGFCGTYYVGSTPAGQICDYPAPMSCPAGETLQGTQCVTTTTTGAVVTYSCPSGGTLSGTTCTTVEVAPPSTKYTCPPGSTLSGSSCVTSTSTPAQVNYSCPDGSAPVNEVCFIHTVSESWADTCTPYEQSAGSTLPPP